MMNIIIALVLAVIAAAQPVTTVRSIELISTPYMARARSWRFIGGLATTLGVVGLGAAIAERSLIQGSSVPTTAIDTTDVVLGAITLIGVVVALTLHRSTRRVDRLDSDRADTAFYLFGIRTMAINISSVALYVAAVEALFASGGSWITTEILLIVITALVLLPGVLPLLIESTAPASADYAIDKLRRLCTTNGPMIAMSAWAVAGAGLLVRGLVN
jgi:hypothetical protein